MAILQYEHAAPHTLEALDNLRNFNTLEWYVIPLIGIVFYIYSSEIKRARDTNNWDPILCSLTVGGVMYLNETWNSWVCWFTGVSAIWTTPRNTAFLLFFGCNVEILFLFIVCGFVYAHLISGEEKLRILGIPNRWFYGFILALFSVITEYFLNKGGLLVWYYSFWDRTFVGFWFILFLGYFIFYLACILVLKLRTFKLQKLAIATLYGIPTLMNLIAYFTGMIY